MLHACCTCWGFFDGWAGGSCQLGRSALAGGCQIGRSALAGGCQTVVFRTLKKGGGVIEVGKLIFKT